MQSKQIRMSLKNKPTITGTGERRLPCFFQCCNAEQLPYWCAVECRLEKAAQQPVQRYKTSSGEKGRAKRRPEKRPSAKPGGKRIPAGINHWHMYQLLFLLFLFYELKLWDKPFECSHRMKRSHLCSIMENYSFFLSEILY